MNVAGELFDDSDGVDTAGTVISLDGQDTEWVRLPNGDWQERPRSGQ